MVGIISYYIAFLCELLSYCFVLFCFALCVQLLGGFLFCFEKESQCVAQSGLQLTIQHLTLLSPRITGIQHYACLHRTLNS